MKLIYLTSSTFNNYYKATKRLQVLLKIRREISRRKKDINSSYFLLKRIVCMVYAFILQI